MTVIKLGRNSRLIGLVVFLVLVAAWNMALSTRRKYYSGNIVKPRRENVKLTVRSPGKIQPRDLQVIHSLIRGQRKKVYVNEGNAVGAGDVLMEISDEDINRELTQKKTAYENLTADVAKAEKDFTLARRLFGQGAIARREVDEAEQTLIRTRQSLKAASQEFILAKKKATGVRVVSPISGMVLKVSVLNKDLINEDDELFTVARLDDLVLRARVDELDISQVKMEQNASLVCEAFPEEKMPGRVSWIGAQAKEENFADVEVLIDIIDKKGLDLKPNLSCKATIVTGEIKDALVLPASAIRRGPDRNFVFKTQWGGWLKPSSVDVTRVTSDSVVVNAGVNEGDSILVPKEK